MEKIFFFGDSITAGQLVNPHENWTTLVSYHLTEKNNHRLVQQVSTNGDTTDHAVLKIDYQVAQHYPNIVFLQFGLNDANRWRSENCINRVSIDQFEDNLRRMISILEQSKVNCIYLLTSHRLLKNHTCLEFPNLSDDARSYNEVVRKVANSSDLCKLVDFEKESNFWLDSFLLNDGIHLSKSGHQLYAKKLLEIFDILL